MQEIIAEAYRVSDARTICREAKQTKLYTLNLSEYREYASLIVIR